MSFYTTSVMRQSSGAKGLFKVKKKNSMLLCDIEGLLNHQPYFFRAIC